MSVSKKYKRNRNYRKKRNSRKLKRAGAITMADILNELYNQQFNHSQNYESTKNKLSEIIGEDDINEWEKNLKTPNFEDNTDSNENPKENQNDMLKFFPDIMNSVPYFKPGNNYEGWQKFYNSNNNPDMEDNKYVMNTYIGVTQNYNYIFKEDADGTLKEEFRKEYGIMVGTNEEAAQDRYLYVISLLLAHFLNPNYIHGKKGGRKTRKRRKSKKSKHSKKSRRSRRRH